MAEEKKLDLDTIVSLCKRRGFIYQSAEIYGGLNGVYDFGPLGTAFKRNITQAWLEDITSFTETVLEIDGSILGHEEVWKASGHVANFSDPMVDCTACKRRFRSDEFDLSLGCPECGSKKLTDPRQFQLMFQTQIGAMSEGSSIAYLRPETAQSIFINFKNVINTCRVKPPFGIAQIGKAFRNEITPRQFLFRVREFEQMEMEFFCHPSQSNEFFKIWLDRRERFFLSLGLKKENLRMREHEKDELAHYARCCTDFEYNFPFGYKELEGLAHRTDFDLSAHGKASGKDLIYNDPISGQTYVPHVVESSVGVGRLLLALMFDSYREEEVEGEPRVVLGLKPSLAPVSAAIFPLVKKLSEPANKLFIELKNKGFKVQFDETGSIGKRYRRQDEIGTPVCFTVDFDSLEDLKATARNRDTLSQERISFDKVSDYLDNVLKGIS